MVFGIGTLDLKPTVALGDIGKYTKGFEMRLAPGLKINRLPDATGGRVPTPLFADGLLGVFHRILHPEDNPGNMPGLGIAERLAQIELERCITTLMVTQ